MTPIDLRERPIVFDHRRSAAAVALPELSHCRPEWLMAVIDAEDDCSVDAAFWERHTDGDEVLYVLEGCIALTTEHEGVPEQTVALAAGQACIVPRDAWRRLQVLAPGRLLLLASHAGTESRRYVPGPAQWAGQASPARRDTVPAGDVSTMIDPAREEAIPC